MSRHLISVPQKGTARYNALLEAGIAAACNQFFAEDIIAGRVIHNLDTDEFMGRDVATDEFKEAAAKAYERFLNLRDAR